MKKTQLLAVCALSALAGSALAQSNVTIYGRANLSLENIKAEGRDPVTGAKVDNSRNEVVNNASRLGFRGTEDLGNGLSALFQYEAGVRADGSAALLGGTRDAFVGLKSNTLGTIKAGVITSPLYYGTHDYISMVNHDTGNTGDVLLWFPAISTTAFFAPNSISYASPTIAGFTFEAMYSLMGERRRDTASGIEKEGHWSAVLNYDNGPLHAAVGYGQTKQEFIAATPEAKDKVFIVSALYDFKAVVVGALYDRAKVENAGTSGFLDPALFVGSHTRNAWRVVAMVPVGANEFHVNYGKAGDWSNTVDNGAKQWTLGWNYNLSKRSKVYAFYTVVDNDSQGNIYGFNNVGLPGGLVDVENRSLAVGVRHNF